MQSSFIERARIYKKYTGAFRVEASYKRVGECKRVRDWELRAQLRLNARGARFASSSKQDTSDRAKMQNTPSIYVIHVQRGTDK